MVDKLTFIIIHGTQGSPKGNWFPWMKKQLEAKGHRVIAPQFPTPKNQNLEAWLSTFYKEAGETDPSEMVLIGHSMGAPLILRLAEKTKTPYKALFAIAPFDCLLDCEFDPLISTFVEKPFNWESIKVGASSITLFAGDNDPYVKLSIPQNIAKALAAPLHTIKGGGHLNAEFGYTEFPQLFNEVQSL